MVGPDTENKRRAHTPTRARAKAMRHDAVTMEKLFWDGVRNRRLGGYKFKRQVPIGRYVADFVCLEKKLIVELDGPFHTARKAYDAARDAFMTSLGYRVLRFTNEELANDVATSLHIVKHALDTGAPSP
jgi:very-short-patch-repair endonuclease